MDRWDIDIPWFPANEAGGHVVRVKRPTSETQPRPYFDIAFGLGFTDNLAHDLFYGNSLVQPDQFMGFASRYSTTDPKIAQCAVNVLDAGGRTNDRNSSIFIPCWGEKQVYMVRREESIVRREESAAIALVVHDWRYAVRVANLDLDDANNQPDIEYHLLQALTTLPNAKDAIIYMGQKCADRFGARNYRKHPVRVVTELRDDEARVI